MEKQLKVNQDNGQESGMEVGGVNYVNCKHTIFSERWRGYSQFIYPSRGEEHCRVEEENKLQH